MQICSKHTEPHATALESAQALKNIPSELEGPQKPVSTFARKYCLPYKVSTLLMSLTQGRH